MEREREELITSPANPTLRYARSLQRRRVRARERALLVEGLRAIRTAIDAGSIPRAVLIDAGRRDELSPDDLILLRSSARRVMLVEPVLFAEVAETEHPQPVIAICELPGLAIPDDWSLLLAIDGVRDPGNLGTLIRTAAAAGADGVVILPDTVDPGNAKAVRSSAGSLFLLPVEHRRTLESLVTERPGVTVAVTEAAAALEYDGVDWSGPVILVIGGEATGVSTDTRTFATTAVRIPMGPGVESLNAAVAGAILLYEVRRQRRRLG